MELKAYISTRNCQVKGWCRSRNQDSRELAKATHREKQKTINQLSIEVKNYWKRQT